MDVSGATDIGAEIAVFDVAAGCPDGMPRCGSQQRCIDLQNDPLNCGTCDNVCSSRADAMPICQRGICEGDCQPPTVLCGQDCVNITTSLANCGGCGRSCLGMPVPTNASGSCTPMGCSFECDEGYQRVGAICVPACQTVQLCDQMNCVVGSGCASVQIMDVAIEDLSNLNNSCTEAAYLNPGVYTWHDCTTAANRLCQSHGATWGYGPVTLNNRRAEIVCVAAPLTTTNVPEATLTALDGACSTVAADNLGCARASARHCAAMTPGNSGWGPLEVITPGPSGRFVIGCIPPSVGTVTHFTAAELATIGGPRACRPGVVGSPARSVTCDQSVHQLCARVPDFIAGVGPISGSEATGYDVLCLRDVLRPR